MNQDQQVKTIPERPIKSIREDQLYRRKFIQRLLRALINPENEIATGVVVGVTGPWGSGKTSILNLLEEEIKSKYKTSLVVRFDPWLVSGRDSIINQFFAELLGSLKRDKKLAKQLSKIISLLNDYSANLAPLADYVVPGMSKFMKYGSSALATALSKRGSLHHVKKELLECLTKIDVPIVVMIDELDRVEDDEVRAIAQLVRAVADFPNVSYLLAFDPDRVIQALGSGAPSDEQKSYGRAYLEKIVQFQIPLPVSLESEIGDLLAAELENLGANFSSDPEWRNDVDFLTLRKTIVPAIIETPRDIKRLVGTFHVLEGMVHGEVNWIDLLGYCVLLVKAPRTAEMVKKHSDAVVENPIAMEQEFLRYGNEKVSAEERLNRINEENERNLGIRELLKFLFPTFRDDSEHSMPSVVDRTKRGGSDYICYRQHLMTVLRHDILPGAFSRADVISLFSRSSSELPHLLREIERSGRFGDFLNRLEDVYPQAKGITHGEFWLGISRYLRRENREWLKTYSPMQEISLTLGRLFLNLAIEVEDFRSSANETIKFLDTKGDVEITPFVLRAHIHLFGLFGWKKRDVEKPFLTEDVTIALLKSQSATYRDQHLTGNWIASLWNLSPVYNMIDVGAWDSECRARLDVLLGEPSALDGFTLLMYGGGFTTEAKDLGKLLNPELYMERVRNRLRSSSIDPTVKAAMRKAIGEL